MELEFEAENERRTDNESRTEAQRSQTFLMLLGAGILQLPIWGTLLSNGFFGCCFMVRALTCFTQVWP